MKNTLILLIGGGLLAVGPQDLLWAEQVSVDERLKALEQQQQHDRERIRKLEEENAALRKQITDPAAPSAVKPGDTPKNAGARVGAGNLTLDGLMEVWFMHDPTTAFGARGHGENTFRLRRGEIALNGDIMSDIGFHIMIDPAKLLSVTQEKADGVVTNVSLNQNSAVLQDLDVRLRLARMFPEIAHFAPGPEAIVGQQKTPLTEEGYRSSAKLDLVERSQIARIFGDRRSTGLLLKDSYRHVDYHAGVFNDGFLLNDVDNNKVKTVAGHLALKPRPPWKIGASVQAGETGADNVEQDRWGLDAQWENTRGSFKAEYLHATDGPVSSRGFYLQPAHFPIPDKVQLVARYDWFDPDDDVDDNTIKELSGGLNWFFHQHNAKFQFQYMRRVHQAPPSGVEDDEDVLLMNLQTAF